jgi:hypothetical protein
MNTGLYRVEFARLAAAGGLIAGRLRGGTQLYGLALIGLALVFAGLGGWMLLSAPGVSPAANVPVRLATATVPAEAGPQDALSPNPEDTPEEAGAVDGLRISSQRWRRGGLGSKALVTFTLRNRNDYAVKDIEISCAFSRRDGSYLTSRTRIIHDTIKMRGRKTFHSMHIGFVNVNADRARCSLVNASPI